MGPGDAALTELAAWVAFPLVGLVACLGAGLLAERAAGLRLSSALVPPLGFCAAIALVGPAYAAGRGAGTALILLAAAAAAGLWLSRGDMAARFRPGVAAATGAGAYAIHMAPVVLSGEATFLGYNFLNDTAVHFVLVDYVSESGRSDPALPPSSFAAAVQGYLGNAYPLGSHELLATLRAALDLDVSRVYQPFLALSVALAATALVALVRREGFGARAAAGAALLAVSGHLFYSLGLQGGIKELTFVTALATAAATGSELLRAERPPRAVIAFALPSLAAYSIYGVAALAWLGPLVLILVGWALLSRGSALRRALLPAALVGLAAFAALGAPTIVDSVEFYRHGEATLTSEAELGPLAGPLRRAQVAGIWLQGDYRRVPDPRGPTYVLIAALLVLAAVGAARALRQRAPGPALIAIPVAVAWIAVSPAGSPYVDAKLLAVASPALVLLAGLGVAVLAERRRAAALAAGAVLAAGVGISDVLAYRVALPAPMDRLEELAEIGERFPASADARPLLLNEFEEYAKHFAREARVSNPYEAWTAEAARLRGDPRPLFGNAYTLDELAFDFVTSYPLIALRRSPAESRPPAGYELEWRGRFYEVWRRPGPQPTAVHESLGHPRENPVTPAVVPPCRLAVELGRATPLRAAVRPPNVVFNFLASGPLPPAWRRWSPHDRYTLAAEGGGAVSASARTGAGPHHIWVKGNLHREIEVRIDGRRVGVARHLNGPGQWVEIGTVDLAAGNHVLELRRAGASLRPGDAQGDLLGPAVAVPRSPDRVLALPPDEGRRLCGTPLDWIERVPTP